MQNFIFGGEGMPKTPQELARMRAIAASLQQRRAPRDVGEGLQALGNGLVAGVMTHRANKAERAGKESASGAFQTVMDAMLGGGSSGGGAMPTPSYSGAVPAEAATTDPVNARVAQGFAAFGGDASTEMDGTKEKFISALMPEAMRVGQEIGVDPRVIVAQAAQETGWGKSAPGNNFFGIKSHGQSGGQNLTTHEVINGQRVKVNDSFRQYESPADSVRGYGEFITRNPRYEPFRTAGSLDEQLAALQESGYATDPNYANSVGSIARSIPMPTQTASLQPMTGGGGVPADPKAALAQALMARQNSGAGQQAIAQAAPQMQPQPAPQPEQQQMAQTQPQGDQGMRAAMQALSNPYLTDGQRMVVQTLLDRQLQSMDPMRKLQMEKLQREISQPVKRDTVTINGRLVDAQTGQEIANFPAAPKAPTVQTIYDPQTGMEKKVQWVDGAWQEVGGVKAPSGTQLRVNPETGEVTFQQGAGLKPLTEGQSKDTVYATRAEGSLPVLNQLDTALTNFGESAGAKMPLIGNYLKSEDYQKAEQAGLEFLQAVLRKDTGAAITADEQDQYGNVYLPRPGDTPGVIAQKRDSRTRALEAIKAGMPPAAILAQEQALRKTGDAPAGQTPAQPGQIDTSGALEKAKAAIAAGAPREAVIKRLMDAGIDPGGL